MWEKLDSKLCRSFYILQTFKLLIKKCALLSQAIFVTTIIFMIYALLSRFIVVEIYTLFAIAWYRKVTSGNWFAFLVNPTRPKVEQAYPSAPAQICRSRQPHVNIWNISSIKTYFVSSDTSSSLCLPCFFTQHKEVLPWVTTTNHRCHWTKPEKNLFSGCVRCVSSVRIFPLDTFPWRESKIWSSSKQVLSMLHELSIEKTK